MKRELSLIQLGLAHLLSELKRRLRLGSVSFKQSSVLAHNESNSELTKLAWLVESLQCQH